MEHTAVVDLGYGDAGKGSIVSWLCATRPIRLVVRFNGGAQAAHNVIDHIGRHHTFSQWTSGTFSGVPTFLSRYVLVNPLRMFVEVQQLADLGVPDPWGLMFIDRDALLTTPYHVAVNQAKERARGEGRHGSCGVGIGETMIYMLDRGDEAPRVDDCLVPTVIRNKLQKLRIWAIETMAQLDQSVPLPEIDRCLDAYAQFVRVAQIVDGSFLRYQLDRGDVVFEGAQGVLLDEWRGWHPYTTWSTCTFDNADALLAEAGHAAHRLGVVRTYTVRHGPGPLVTEDAVITTATPELHNGLGEWQGAFRMGHFDAIAHRYAIEVCGGIDSLAVTHLDRVPTDLKICSSYVTPAGIMVKIPVGPFMDLEFQESLTNMLLKSQPLFQAQVVGGWSDAIAQVLDAPVLVESWGPRSDAKRAVDCAGCRIAA